MLAAPRAGAASPRRVNSQAADAERQVDDVVATLTRGDGAGLAQSVRHAAEEYDAGTAEAFARALLEALCQTPLDPRRLEALLILGLAHPSVLELNRISLPTEGERLALLLEQSGQTARAAGLRRAITDSGLAAGVRPQAPAPEKDARGGTIAPPGPEELMRDAERALARGDREAAIKSLRAILGRDRKRTDVARMIRDLRWEQQAGRVRAARRLKLFAIAVVLSSAVAGLVWRENSVRARYRAIPLASSGDLAAMRARVDAIDDLVAREKAWLGMPLALRERSRLQNRIASTERSQEQARREVEQAAARTRDEAEALGSRGLLLAKQGRFGAALDDLRRALELGGPAWSRRDEIASNVTAIAAWLEEHPEERNPAR